jgi:hypothetical protein
MSPLYRSPSGNDEPERAERSLGLLLADLASDQPEVRRGAVQVLSDMPEDLSEVLPALVRRVGAETDALVRTTLCAQLARHDRVEVVDGLIPHLASNDAGLRNAVSEVLSKTPASTALRIPQLLSDPDPDVRILTVMLLTGLRLTEVEGWLIQLIQGDGDPLVVAAAMGELIALAGARCEPVLRSARQRFPDDPFISFMTAESCTGVESARR